MTNYKVSIRNGFSDRNQIQPISRSMQITDFDTRTRVQIFYYIGEIFDFFKSSRCDSDKAKWVKSIYKEIYSVPYEGKNTIYTECRQALNLIRETIENGQYDEILSILEFLSNQYIFKFHMSNSYIHDSLNGLFEKEFVGYRYIDKYIVPITDDVEIKTIKNVCSIENYPEMQKHIEKALIYLSDREKPDYENSVKESISAVEAMCSYLTGEKDSLGKLLDRFEKHGLYIHPVLKSAFDKLFGYTCKASGIRHAGNIGGPSTTFAEAQFMLVTCSAFINYLKINESNIELYV